MGDKELPTAVTDGEQGDGASTFLAQLRSRLIQLRCQLAHHYRHWRSTRPRLLILFAAVALAAFILICLSGSSRTLFSSPPTSSQLVKEVDMLEDVIPEEGNGMVTAVLLNWTRKENLVLILKRLCSYRMFKDVIIWNNNGDVQLTHEYFASVGRCARIRIINSPANLYFIARYMACAMATTPYCYFQDDDWIVPQLRSMYANFLRFPQLVHTDTNAAVYALTNWKWCFFNDGVKLHACFSWVGTGAFASRELVLNFLRQTSVTKMDTTEFAYGDMYFTTYANQVPYQLENALQELPQENAFSAGNGRIRNKVYMHKALKRIYKHLTEGTHVFETKELYPKLYQRDVRSPCFNDRCLFITNKHSFPDVRLFRYRPNVDISESERIHERYHGTKDFIAHPYSHAVDGQNETAWKSHEAIRAGDYFGLDLLMSMPVPVTFRLLLDHPKEYFSSLVIHVSQNGEDWDLLDPPPKIVYHDVHTSDADLLACTFRVPRVGYRFIRLTSTQDWTFTFGIYSFSFSGRMEMHPKDSSGPRHRP